MNSMLMVCLECMCARALCSACESPPRDRPMKPIRVLRHAADEALGTLETTLRSCGLALEVVDCFSVGWASIERAGFDPARFAGLVVMGGPMNVDQTSEHPHLATEVEWLRTAVYG